MPLTVLFDLDDTLLDINFREFFSAYHAALSQAISHLGTHERIINQINYAVSQMNANQDPGKSLKQVFAENFYLPLGSTQSACQTAIDAFYDNEFPKLHSLVLPKPGAKELIAWCKSQDINIAIATNPLFPKTATYQKLIWAGLDPEDFVFYSSFDDFHFTKPNLTYYAEVLGRLGWGGYPVVMIGDSVPNDLLPMEKIGYQTFWVCPQNYHSNRVSGNLGDIKPWLQSIKGINQVSISNSPDVQLAVLRSSPAVIDSWVRSLPWEAFLCKPSKNEWSFVEVLWHMADYEREIHQVQWEQLLIDSTMVVTPVATSTWAEERHYQHRDPEEAFHLFLESRMKSLALINDLWDKNLLDTTILHSIFSKAKISELIMFSAKHDQLHLNQCFNLLNNYKK